MASKPRHLLSNENRTLKKRVEDLERELLFLKARVWAMESDRPIPIRPAEPFPHDPFTLPHIITANAKN